MKRMSLLWLAMVLFFTKTIAQVETNSDFINQMNTVFSTLEKNRVPNGLLLDYSIELADLTQYKGVLTDSNKVNAGILRDIYSTTIAYHSFIIC